VWNTGLLRDPPGGRRGNALPGDHPGGGGDELGTAAVVGPALRRSLRVNRSLRLHRKTLASTQAN
jgi:hypothetical protein